MALVDNESVYLLKYNIMLPSMAIQQTYINVNECLISVTGTFVSIVIIHGRSFRVELYSFVGFLCLKYSKKNTAMVCWSILYYYMNCSNNLE